MDAVDTEAVLKVLQPIWTEKPEMAQETHGYVATVLDAAPAKGHRSGGNPARWGGHLDHLLPKPAKLSRGHHAAMPFADVPAFTAALRQREGPAARALKFLILNASRTSEVTRARWEEINLTAGLRIIPAARMKSGRAHRVPLTPAALSICTA